MPNPDSVFPLFLGKTGRLEESTEQSNIVRLKLPETILSNSDLYLKILGISCSPRAKGNTEILVREALAGAEEEGADVEFLTLSSKDVEPCNHCGSCYEKGECCIQDDMQEIYPKLLEADGIIIGTPVYFWTVTAQAKILMDRTYALRYSTMRLKDKIGGAIAVAGRRGQLTTLATINTFFLGQGMIPASLGVDAYGSKVAEVKNDKRALAGAKRLGETMVALANSITSS